MALVSPRSSRVRGAPTALVLLGLFGASLFYGDGMVTPAMTVLSAVEGLKLLTPAFDPYVIPITLLILGALFTLQHRGTARVGGLFGPVMITWFLVLAVLGVVQLVHNPQVLAALNPAYALSFLVTDKERAFLVMGSVFLVVTGGEAIYADMGHFGKRPIRLMWFLLILPALLLNYFGQGALILADPTAAHQPFFLMAPRWALYPLVLLATAASVIASQAVISGVFSITRQAVLLGYLPRMRIEHTSSHRIGQIYMPTVNWIIMFAAIGLVLSFGSSSALAGAYGMAVTTDMLFTTVLFAAFALGKWQSRRTLILAGISLLLVVDLSFWTSNLHKIPDGGWFPLVVALIAFSLMLTWRKGRSILAERQDTRTFPAQLFVADVRSNPPLRVPGTAVFLDSNPTGTPPALMHNLKHNHVLHEQVVFLTVLVGETPEVEESARFEVTSLGAGIFRILIHLGFAEEIDIPALLNRCTIGDGSFDPMQTTFFLGRERLIATRHSGMPRWSEKLFALMFRTAEGVTPYFHLPPNRVVEMGTQVEL
jgi:KUP system potassium uptake protein